MLNEYYVYIIDYIQNKFKSIFLMILGNTMTHHLMFVSVNNNNNIR